MKTVAASIILIIALALVGPSAARGAKTYGDSCNFIASGIQIFSDSNYAEACDTDRNLVCALNKCDCIPGYRWEQNFFESLFGAGGQCTRDGTTSRSSGMKTVGAVFVTALAALFIQAF